MKGLLVVFLVLLVLLAGCNSDNRLLQENIVPAPPNGILPIMSLAEVKGLERGCSAIIRTVIEGNQKVDLNAQYLEIQGTDDNCLILCQTLDPQFATWGGIVAGMSGSPVIIDGRIIGALAYAFSGTINPPYLFGVTPIEYMLALCNKKPMEDNLDETMKAPAVSGKIYFKPLVIPISITGQSREASSVDFGDNTEVFFNPFSTMKVDGKEGFSPGDTIAVDIVSGPICNIDAHGTITYVDGNDIYAFGHPMFQSGNTSLPFRKSWVHQIISSNDIPFKFSSAYGDILGAIDKDFSNGIMGEAGSKPSIIPVKIDYIAPNGNNKTATHFVARGQEWTVGEIFSSCVNAWRDEKSPGTAKVHLEVSFEETSKKFQRDYFFAGEDPFGKIYNDLCGTIFNKAVTESFSSRVENNVAKATIDNIYINITDLSDIMSAEIVSLNAPQNVKAGDTFEIEVGYKPYRKPVEYSKYSLDVPAWFHLSSATLTMSVKADQYERDESVPNDLDSYIDKISKDFIPLNVGVLKLSAYYGQEVITKDILTPWVISGSKELKINITK